MASKDLSSQSTGHPKSKNTGIVIKKPVVQQVDPPQSDKSKAPSQSKRERKKKAVDSAEVPATTWAHTEPL